MSTDNKDNCPKLRRALKRDDVTTVQAIFNLGFDINMPLDSVTGNTALILATCYGSARVLPVVLDYNPSLDICNNEGRTALDKAILSYSLAHQFWLHKITEEQHRYFILRLMVSSGCKVINPKDLELCVRMNEKDRVFLSNLVHVIQSSTSGDLKSVTMAVLISLDVNYTFIKRLLISGASFGYFRKTWPTKLYHTRRPLSMELLATMARATCDIEILQIISDHFKSVLNSPRTPMRDYLTVLLLLSGLPRVPRPKLSKIRDKATRAMLADLYCRPPTLRHISRRCIRQHSYPNVYYAVNHLPIPSALRTYVTLEPMIHYS